MNSIEDLSNWIQSFVVMFREDQWDIVYLIHVLNGRTFVHGHVLRGRIIHDVTWWEQRTLEIELGST